MELLSMIFIVMSIPLILTSNNVSVESVKTILECYRGKKNEEKEGYPY